MCFGFLKKGIYITIEDLTEEELEMLFRHELYHYKRQDLFYKFLLLLEHI